MPPPPPPHPTPPDPSPHRRPDGLFGFSQGGAATAVFVAQLATRQAAGLDLHVPAPRFAVICSGFLPRDPEYASLIQKARPGLASLFICGQADQLVPPERMDELAGAFDPATARVFSHPGARRSCSCSRSRSLACITTGAASWSSLPAACIAHAWPRGPPSPRCHAPTNAGAPPCGAAAPAHSATHPHTPAPLPAGAHMVPTCTGDFRQQLTAFLDGACPAPGPPLSSSSASLAVSDSGASLAASGSAASLAGGGGVGSGAGVVGAQDAAAEAAGELGALRVTA